METKMSRKALSVNGNLKKITEETLMQEVGDVLGYRELTRARELQKVAEILHELEIEPLELKKVEAYKKEVRKEAQKVVRRNSNYYDRWMWKSIPLRKYTKEVPAFALLRALSVQKKLNEVTIEGTFHVEELARTRVNISYPDPFMVLHVAGKKLYIDVWDEPKFEGRRTV